MVQQRRVGAGVRAGREGPSREGPVGTAAAVLPISVLLPDARQPARAHPGTNGLRLTHVLQHRRIQPLRHNDTARAASRGVDQAAAAARCCCQ